MMKNKQIPMKIYKVMWVLGLLGALSGAFLMWNGHLLGEDAASLGRTIGIIGILAIGAAAIRRERN
jgi:hypothetical protein